MNVTPESRRGRCRHDHAAGDRSLSLRAIRFEAQGDPLSTNFCHCESCRRHSGGPAAAFVTFPKDAVRWSGAERAWSAPHRPWYVASAASAAAPSPMSTTIRPTKSTSTLGHLMSRTNSRPASTPTMASASSGSTRSTIPALPDQLQFGQIAPRHRTCRINQAADRLWANSADHCPNSASIKKSAFCRHDPRAGAGTAEHLQQGRGNSSSGWALLGLGTPLDQGRRARDASLDLYLSELNYQQFSIYAPPMPSITLPSRGNLDISRHLSGQCPGRRGKRLRLSRQFRARHRRQDWLCRLPRPAVRPPLGPNAGPLPRPSGPHVPR